MTGDDPVEVERTEHMREVRGSGARSVVGESRAVVLPVPGTYGRSVERSRVQRRGSVSPTRGVWGMTQSEARYEECAGGRLVTWAAVVVLG